MYISRFPFIRILDLFFVSLLGIITIDILVIDVAVIRIRIIIGKPICDGGSGAVKYPGAKSQKK